MISTLLVVQLILAVLIVITVMLQKSANLGLGAYSGSNESMFGAKGPANFLVRATFILGIVFVANTIFLGYSYNTKKETSIIDNVDINSLIPAAPKQENTEAPSAPTIPVTN